MNNIQSIRKDWKLIESLINKNAKVLDIGCCEGGLIKQLEENIQANTRGIELNPELARKAIDYEREVGLLMPCNVIFWENEDKTVTISFVDAEKQLSSCDNVELLKIGKDVNLMLIRAID